MDLVAVENALQNWAVAALGFPEEAVLWQPVQAPVQVRPYATLKLSGPFPVASEIHQDVVGAGPAEEIEFTLAEHQEWTLSVQVYAVPNAGAGTAKALLNTGRLRMQLPSRAELVAAVGLVVVELGDTQDLTALIGTAYESRAVMDVRLRTVDQASERTTFIERVGITSPWGTYDLP